jgi:hypothetical protein
MSLTRKEWLKMWSAISLIEFQTDHLANAEINKQIKQIKKMIQSVVGQLEQK